MPNISHAVTKSAARIGPTHGPERQPSKKALSRTDQDCALERRTGDGHEFPDHAALVGVCEWQVRENTASRPGPPVRKKNIV